MIGIIGGTGLYRMEALHVTQTREVTTPFGPPSSPLILGELAGREVAFLARHGLHHDLLPSEINFRANIWALKSVGARTVIGVSAVGSLREEIRPGDISLPSQYVDFTKGIRAASFFGRGIVAHISTAQPVCRSTAGLISLVARSLGTAVHENKTNATDYDLVLVDVSQHVSADHVITLFHINLGRVHHLIAGAVSEYVEYES